MAMDHNECRAKIRKIMHHAAGDERDWLPHDRQIVSLVDAMADEIECLKYTLAIDEHKSVEAGKRIGHAQVLRHVHQRLSTLSTAEECRADMSKLHQQYEAVHGSPINLVN